MDIKSAIEELEEIKKELIKAGAMPTLSDVLQFQHNMLIREQNELMAIPPNGIFEIPDENYPPTKHEGKLFTLKPKE